MKFIQYDCSGWGHEHERYGIARQQGWEGDKRGKLQNGLDYSTEGINNFFQLADFLDIRRF